jgi:hypothetical protein
MTRWCVVFGLPAPSLALDNHHGHHQRVIVTRWCVHRPCPLDNHQRVFMTRWCVVFGPPAPLCSSTTTTSTTNESSYSLVVFTVFPSQRRLTPANVSQRREGQRRPTTWPLQQQQRDEGPKRHVCIVVWALRLSLFSYTIIVYQ